tara:strand:+ start:300 stop:434 length:135 start_codon:yes stop_codon:yes gene_type:complete
VNSRFRYRGRFLLVSANRRVIKTTRFERLKRGDKRVSAATGGYK